MAQSVLSIVGYAVGFYYGGPSGGAAGAAIGGYIGGQYDIANQKFEGARIPDLKIPGLEYGSGITRLWGSCRLSGNIIWTSGKREVPNTTGGKGGAEPQVTNYTYEVDVLILLTDNPIQAVPRVWSNGELIYTTHVNSTKESLGASAVSPKWADMRVYTGSDEQLPDPVYEAAVGIGNAPAYRGRGTVFIESLQLGGSGQMPALNFEVCTLASVDHECVATNDPDMQIWADAGQAVEGNAINWSLGGAKASIAGTQFEYVDHVIRTNAGVGGCRRYFEVYMIGYASSAITSASMMIREGYDGYSVGINTQQNAITEDGIGIVETISYPIGVVTGFRLDENGSVLGIAVDCDTGKLWVRQGAYWYGVTNTADPNTLSGGYQTGLDPARRDLFIEFCERGGTFSIDVEIRTIESQFTYPMPDGFIPWAADSADVDIVTPSDVDLADVVRDLCVSSAIDESLVDVSELEGTTVVGVPVTQVSAARATLGVLASAYYFDCVESDKLYFRTRGRFSSAEIGYGFLGAAEDEASQDDPLGLERANDIEVPARFALQYINQDADYQAGTVHSDRIVSESAETRTMSLPIVLPPSRAQGLVDTAALDARVAAQSIKPSVDDRRPKLEPTDVVTVLDDVGNAYRARLIRETYAAGVRKFEAVLDDASVLSESGATQQSTPGFSVTGLSETRLELLDIPILRDEDNSPGVYAAVRSTGGRWPGAAIFASRSETTGFEQVATVTRQATMGVTSTELGTWVGGNVFDEQSTVTVELDNGTLSSTTSQALLEGQPNAALIGREIVQFRSAALIAPGVYTLSGFLRGRRGTVWAVGGHEDGERFVLLSDSGIVRIAHPAVDIGVPKFWRAVTAGKAVAGARSVAATDTGVALKPFAPVDIRAAVDSAQNMVITWRRRSRLQTKFLSPVGVPLGEASEAYRVTIKNDADVVLRTLNPTLPTVTYTRAQQLADGTSATSDLTVVVQQVSAVVGAGFEASATIKGAAQATSQITEITVGGTFEQDTDLRVTVGSSQVEYTTQPGETLSDVAEELADLIDATSYSATAVGPVVAVTGSLGAPFVTVAEVLPGDNTFTASLQQAPAAQSAGERYQALATIAQLVTGVTDPIPAGVTFYLSFERPAGMPVGSVSYTTPSVMTSSAVLGYLSDAVAAHYALPSEGYIFNPSTYAGTPTGYVYGPPGVTGVSFTGGATNNYGISVSILHPGSAAVPASLPQIVDFTLSGTPGDGWVYRVTLNGIDYEYTAGPSEAMADIADELAALIDASADFIASAAGLVITVERSAAAISFSYQRQIVASDMTLTVEVVQEAQ